MGMHRILSDEDGDSLVADVMRAQRPHGRADGHGQRGRARLADGDDRQADGPRPNSGPTQCHDITLYPAIGLAGGACAGYGLLLDISDPVHPKRIFAVSDSNFSLLALGDVQQRRHQAPVLGRVGRRRPAQVPGDRSEGVGSGRDLHRQGRASCTSRATTSCRPRRRRRRTASPTTARSFRSPAGT